VQGRSPPSSRRCPLWRDSDRLRPDCLLHVRRFQRPQRCWLLVPMRAHLFSLR
jgi:hypothetical protein